MATSSGCVRGKFQARSHRARQPFERANKAWSDRLTARADAEAAAK
jgi:hypothetical protein